jgi:alpha-mannosidase
MSTLHLVPHTHWDREWYLPFQVFRIKLVRLMDRLLDMQQTDPDFSSYTLDGQTILLEDYLAVRPQREADLILQIRAGRLHIGPWYILPDEFLVSPEAIVRNLLRGRRLCDRFGSRMQVGYLPDPFGHIGQMPQILQGFGLNYAAFKRGLSSRGCEMQWHAPDDSSVLTSYLRDGYDNAARLPTDESSFMDAISAARDSLLPHCESEHLLLLNGSDHHEPQPEIPSLVSGWPADEDALTLSSLKDYFHAVEGDLDRRDVELPSIHGELRDPSRHHLLAGVLSSRMWIKQRNHACEVLLERWAEPFSAWRQALELEPSDRILWTGHLATPLVQDADALLDEAWRILLTCQPHDSICGCSIDQVHEEMRRRFDQVEQIGVEIRNQALAAIAQRAVTDTLPGANVRGALITFNPHGFPRGGYAEADFELPAGLDRFEIINARGQPIAYEVLSKSSEALADMRLDRDALSNLLKMVQDGEVMGLSVQSAAVVPLDDYVLLEVAVAEGGRPDRAALQEALETLRPYLRSDEKRSFRLLARFASRVSIAYIAPEIPAHGYTALALAATSNPPSKSIAGDGNRVDNGLMRVELDRTGSLTLTDLRDGSVFSDLLRFRDQADRGDSYTFCPIEGGQIVTSPTSVSACTRTEHACRKTLSYDLTFHVPEGVNDERDGRSDVMTTLMINVEATLRPESPALDLHVTVTNQARDHRLQALFCLPFEVEEALYDGHYEIVRRPTLLPQDTDDWIEQPTAEKPMRNFVAVQGDGKGLMIANRGLREASVSPEGEIAVTLLRCFGWLSRDDLKTRSGGAGPQLPTPGGQEQGTFEFDLRVIPMLGELYEAIKLAEAFQTPLRGVGQPLHGGSLPPDTSLLRLDPESFALTAVKTAHDGRTLVVRGVNLSPEVIQASIETHQPMREAYLSRLDETEEAALTVEGGRRIHFDVGPNQIITLRLSFQPVE